MPDGIEEKVEAIKIIEDWVCAAYLSSETPSVLARTLFHDLKNAVSQGGASGTPMSLVAAEHRIGKAFVKNTFSSNALRMAASTLADRLQHCRPAQSATVLGDDRPGTGYIEARIADVPHLVVVRGPRGKDRGRDDRLLYLTCEFRRHDVPQRSFAIDSPLALLNVFLCHASQDKKSVRQLYEGLRHLPIDLWLDEAKLLPGQDWEREIRLALRAAHIVLVCLSDTAVTREGFVQKEIRIALDIADEKPEGSIFLIPVRLNECDVPDRLKRWQWVDFYRDNDLSLLAAALKVRAANLGLRWPH